MNVELMVPGLPFEYYGDPHIIQRVIPGYVYAKNLRTSKEITASINYLMTSKYAKPTDPSKFWNESYYVIDVGFGGDSTECRFRGVAANGHATRKEVKSNYLSKVANQYRYKLAVTRYIDHIMNGYTGNRFTREGERRVPYYHDGFIGPIDEYGYPLVAQDSIGALAAFAAEQVMEEQQPVKQELINTGIQFLTIKTEDEYIIR